MTDKNRSLHNIDLISDVVIISILPVLAVLLLSIPFLLISKESQTNPLLQTLFVLPLAFIAFPNIYLRKRHKKPVKIYDRYPTKLELLIYILGIVTVYIRVSLVSEINAILFVSAQMLIVSISEEYWARGCLIWLFNKCGFKSITIVIISSLIFTFITHMNRGILDNLVYRLPGALVMSTIYFKTKNIKNSIMFHFIYNLYFAFY